MKLLVENIRRKVLKGIETADYAWVTRKLDKLNGQVDRIASLLNELMDVSRIQAGNINLQLENVDIAELVRDISYRHGELLASNGCELRLDARGPVTGRWDALRLEQVVSNLLSNAAKYGGGHPVEIRLLTEDDLAILTVRDHGVGIASNHLDKIFERFERVGDKSAFAGTGLGLWIVKRFVTAMGGTIAVESTPGEGATFTVKLPRGTH
jgi:signal transduction histidine kinase